MNSSSHRIILKIIKVLKHPVKSYKKALYKHPVKVQSIQTGCLYATSDLIAQLIFEPEGFKQINWRRTGVFFATGACFTGPVISLWFRFLSKKIGIKGFKVVIKKVIADQLIFAPCLHLFLITTVNTLHGHNLLFIKEQIRLKYIDILSTSIKLWPAVQFVNFTFIPTHYQVLFGQTVALFWNVYVSWKTQHGFNNQLTVEKQNSLQ